MFQQRNKRNMANAKVKDTKRKPEDCKTPAVKQARYCRGKLGQKLFVETPYFDLSDPNMHVTDTKYNNLHDPHLRKFFDRQRRKKLVNHGLITKDNKVLCSLKEFNQHQRYRETTMHNWEKNFLQEQKLQMKQFMEQKMTEGALETPSEEMKVLLMDKARISFRKVCRKFSSADEVAWVKKYKLQLEKMEKEVMRELRLERRFKMDEKEKKANMMEASVKRSGSPVFTAAPSSSDEVQIINLADLEVSSSVSPSPSSERDETSVMDMMDQETSEERSSASTSSETSSLPSDEPAVSGVSEESVFSDVDRAAGHSLQVLATILEESSEGEAEDLEDLDLEDLEDLDLEDLEDLDLEDLEDLDLDLDLDLDPDLDLDLEDLDLDLESLPEKPKEDQTKVEGTKLKKKKNRMRAFFQRAWRAMKRTFCSKKVFPIG
ncbi:fibrous sheath-interacting protein 2-like isoform X2 [Trichomycterus rosablanca]|uniref:fibrous sheath-interacting protein 2-like isoform X2 n=1 Tax=Trichomycterus rosablanca TaxID=2290929 RepID=UPI002F359F27